MSNKRVLFYNKARLAARKTLTSIPHRHILSAQAVDHGRGFAGIGSSSTLTIHSGETTYTYEFRGGNKAQRAYNCIVPFIL